MMSSYYAPPPQDVSTLPPGAVTARERWMIQRQALTTLTFWCLQIVGGVLFALALSDAQEYGMYYNAGLIFLVVAVVMAAFGNAVQAWRFRPLAQRQCKGARRQMLLAVAGILLSFVGAGAAIYAVVWVKKLPPAPPLTAATQQYAYVDRKKVLGEKLIAALDGAPEPTPRVDVVDAQNEGVPIPDGD